MALDSRIRIVVAGNFIALAARMGLVTFLGIYFVHHIGIEMTLVGTAFLVENLTRGMVAPVFGALSDRVGRRGPLLAGLLANAVVLPCFLLVDSVPALIAWSVAMGISGATQFPIGNALLADLAPAARRQYVFAINYTAISIGYTVGVAPAGYIAQYSYPLLAALASAGYLAVAVFFAFALRGPLPRESVHAGGSFAGRLLGVARDRVFLGFAALAIVFPFSMGLFAFVLALFAADAGASEGQIGLILAANGIFIALLAVPVAARIEPKGPFRPLAAAAALCAGAFGCFALVPNAAWALASGVVVLTAAELVFSSAVPASVTKLAPGGLRGAYQGAWSFVQALGMGSSFVVSGLLRESIGWRGAWGVFALLALAAAIGLAAARSALQRASAGRGGES